MGQPAKGLQNKSSADWGEPADQEGLPVAQSGSVPTSEGGATVSYYKGLQAVSEDLPS